MRNGLFIFFLVLLTYGSLAQQEAGCERKVEGLSAAEFTISQNFPNPAKEITFIKIQLNSEGPVSLKVYDLLGNPVSSLLDQNMIPGVYSVEVDAGQMPNGIYFYVLKKACLSQTVKMIVSR